MSSRILVAIMGCELHAQKGFHQAIRETWGRDVSELGFGDLKFFVGRGNRALESDEIRLDVPDNKETLLYKVSGLLRWGIEQNYDMILKVNTNTYVNVPEMQKQNYEGVDYAGTAVGRLGGIYSGAEVHGFIQGSASWLSARAARLVIDTVVPYALRRIPDLLKYTGWIAPYLHSEDLWIGQVLTPHLPNLRVVIDPGYANGPLTFWSQSGYIKLYCLPEWMHALHSIKNDSRRMIEVNEEWKRKGL